MALNKLYATASISQGDMIIDAAGYLIVDNSTGMHAYQWTGSTLVHKDSVLTVSTKFPNSKSILYNGTNIFRMFGTTMKAYTFDGSVFAEVASTVISTGGLNIAFWGCKYPGDQIFIVSYNFSPSGNTGYLYTCIGNTFSFKDSKEIINYTGYQYPGLYGAASRSVSDTDSFYFSDSSYPYVQYIVSGPLLGTNQTIGVYSHVFFGGRGQIFDSSVGYTVVLPSYYYTPHQYHVTKVNWDGTYLYGIENNGDINQFDISTNPFTVVQSANYTGTSLAKSLIGGNGIIYVSTNAPGETLSVWGSTVPVTADFSGTPLSGYAPLTVQFTDTSTGSPTSWDWDFGDGSSHNTTQNPTHIYTVAGVYTVTLIATSGSGSDTKIKTNYITVNMVANFTAIPTTGTDTLSVSFTDTSTGTPTSWAWVFGDSATSTEQNPIHIYSAAGVYTVVLRAARGSFEDTETKSEYIKIGFTDSITKYAYIILTPRLSTDDVAIPPSRPELKVMYADGVGNYLFIKKGIRVILPAQSSIEEGSGFARSSGPSVIFD